MPGGIIPGGIIPIGGIPGGMPGGMPGSMPGIGIPGGALIPLPLLFVGIFPRVVLVAFPGPPGVLRIVSSVGGGPSTVRLTILSPRSMTKPNARFSCFSSLIPPPFLPLILLNSSVSPNTIFICLSNAKNTPTNVRESFNVIFNR